MYGAASSSRAWPSSGKTVLTLQRHADLVASLVKPLPIGLAAVAVLAAAPDLIRDQGQGDQAAHDPPVAMSR